jgi:hypothetical protein
VWVSMFRTTFGNTLKTVLIGVVGASVYLACSAERGGFVGSSGTSIPTDPCASPNPGCPCDDLGTEAACGTVKIVSGDYITCSLGKMKCDGARWGTCEGDRVAFKSTGPVGDLKTLGIGMPTACTGNPCAPDCVVIPDNSTGDDAGVGLTPSDGGWGLTATDAPADAPPLCSGLQCNVPVCPGFPNGTQITGTVRDPIGLSPLWNAIVMIPNDPTAVVPIATGPVADPSGCGGVNLPPAISFAQTGVNGVFTLNNVPIGAAVPLVIQVGKWRRQFTVDTRGPCGTTIALPAAQTRLPRNTGEGAMPRIGLVTGGYDRMECFLRRMGIDDAEFTSANKPVLGRVELYRGNGATRTGDVALPGRTVMGARLNRYDMAILPCNGNAEYNVNTVANLAVRNQLVAYANAGGRIFTSHWGQEWIARTGEVLPPFPGTATFSDTVSIANNTTVNIDTSFPRGLTFGQWMTQTGGSVIPNTFVVNSFGSTVQTRTATAPTSQRYAFFNRPGPPIVPSALNYAFDTPLAAGAKFGRVMMTDMHLSKPSTVATDGAATTFPEECAAAGTPLSPQELAAEFLFFDLGGCANPVPPLPPQAWYNPGTLTRDYTAVCPAGKLPKWRFLYWTDTMPNPDAGTGASIVFRAQIGPSFATLGPTVTLATETMTRTVWTGVDLSNAVTYPGLQPHRQSLRLTIELNPTSSNRAAPVLTGIQQTYDCVDSE